jgi:hypothetical protein
LKKFNLSCAIVVLGTVLAALPASAQVQLQAGNNPQPNEANVLLQNGSSGTSITGTTNTNPVFNVLFTAENGTTPTDAPTTTNHTFFVNSNNTGGQAKIFDGLTTDVNGNDKTHLIQGFTITVPGSTGTLAWNDLIFDAHVDGLSTPRSLTVTGTTTDGGTFSFPDQTIDTTLGSGNNFFTLTSGTQTLQSVTLFSSQGIIDYEQIRLSFGSGVTVTPEGASWALLLPGLLPLGFALRRRRSNKS